jgi:hypothetical protein
LEKGVKKKFRQTLKPEEMENRIEIMSQPRIRHKLLLAFQYFPEIRECSHESIAEFIGNARESVTRVLENLTGI